jgi:UDP-N-acetylmuramoyl-L-alanyl-D-glutamate--2,6-diaminopimelate ligase
VSPSGSRFRLFFGSGRVIDVRLRIPGRVNVYNAAGALASCIVLGCDPDRCVEALESFPGVPGRLEVVDEGQDFLVAVDYAHTPDALERVLLQAREMAAGRVIAVIGAGGDRDRTKRPKMGAIASELADLLIVTSDNPRSEDPGAIIRDITAGVDGPASVVVEPDRREAIRAAIRAGSPGDVVIIAGKGHEDYQIVKGVRLHFDDREEARSALGSVRGR